MSEGMEKAENQSVPKSERELKASLKRERSLQWFQKKEKVLLAETE